MTDTNEVILDKPVKTTEYDHFRDLKYGCNPHQKPAALYTFKGMHTNSKLFAYIILLNFKNTSRLRVRRAIPNTTCSSTLEPNFFMQTLNFAGEKGPFEVLNGNPGYINLLDAMNAWQLVKELRIATNLPAAASFKHVSPAGCAVAVPLSPILAKIYGVEGMTLSHSAVAYLRARQADPKSSFGDFAALSDKVDAQTAEFLQREVSDGIIAPDYDDDALEILKAKKGGNYIILKADNDYVAPPMEYREVYGVCFAQRRNDTQITGAPRSLLDFFNRPAHHFRPFIPIRIYITT